MGGDWLSTTDDLRLGRDAYRERRWTRAFDAYTAADRAAPLEPADLERYAWSAVFTGHQDEADVIGARTHHDALRSGDIAMAARAAFWLGFGLIDRGEPARGSGWLARAERLIDDHRGAYVEEGYLQLPSAFRSLVEGDPGVAFRSFQLAADIAARFGDPDLMTLSLLGRGQAHIALGEPERGLATLDEAMVAVTGDEVSPLVVGIVYCAIIEACQEMFDLRRAQEWTAALQGWLDRQPDLVPFRGQCLLYRAELLRFHGSWPAAAEEVERAHDFLSRPPPEPAVAAATYQRGELHRLRGEFASAEAAYREAAMEGRQPQPGLALLRLAQGRPKAAAAALRRAIDEATDRSARARLLDPFVEIAIAVGDLEAARAAAAELATIADRIRAPLLAAIAGRAEGAVRLADGDARSALGALRQAWAKWQSLDAPYEAASTRVLIALACRSLGDVDTARLEFDAARRVFQDLEAQPDVQRVDAAVAGSLTPTAGRLTARELEVLRLIAAGRTNRAIADELVISEKTVARHVSNIFVKLDVSTRSAATAYAFRNGLV